MRRVLVWMLPVAALYAASVSVFSIGAGPVLWPPTDAVEYASMATWMARGEGPWLRIGPAFLPARVPPTTAVLLLPQALLGGDATAYWKTTACFGLATVLLWQWLALRLGLSILGATTAAALLALSPGFAAYSGFVMSEVPSLFFLVLLLAVALVAMTNERPRALAIASIGVLAGLLATFRVTNAIYLPVLVLLWPHARERLWRRPTRLMLMAAGAAIPFALVLWYQARVFGNPRATGYDYWGFGAATGVFDWRFAFDAAGRASEGGVSNVVYYARQLAGSYSDFLARTSGWTSDFHALPVAVLGAIGLVFAIAGGRLASVPRRVLVALLLAEVAIFAPLLPFTFRDWRYVFPIVLLSAFGGGWAVDRIATRLPARARPIVPALLLGAVVASLLPLPAPSRPVRRLHETIAAERAALAGAAPGPGVVRTALPLPLAALLAPAGVVLVPTEERSPILDAHRVLVRKRAPVPVRIDAGRARVWFALVHDRSIE